MLVDVMSVVPSERKTKQSLPMSSSLNAICLFPLGVPFSYVTHPPTMETVVATHMRGWMVLYCHSIPEAKCIVGSGEKSETERELFTLYTSTRRSLFSHDESTVQYCLLEKPSVDLVERADVEADGVPTVVASECRSVCESKPAEFAA